MRYGNGYELFCLFIEGACLEDFFVQIAKAAIGPGASDSRFFAMAGVTGGNISLLDFIVLYFGLLLVQAKI